MQGFFGLSVQQRLIASAAAIVTVSAVPAAAQTRTFDVPAQPASQGIPSFARQAGVQIIASGRTVRVKRTNKVQGRYSVEEGLKVLLQGTGLTASPPNANGMIIIQEASPVGEALAGSAAADNGSAEQIVVTGSRIKGAATASPTTTVTAEQIHKEGRSDLGQVIRDLSQNFNGGQNPGVLPSASGTNANYNLTGGSSMNLRGLGSDATLTLLNGKRMTYTGVSNAIDVTAIPIAAVDRIDIVTDGASAIYGSDAVAGVANVILRRDYDGLTATLRGGTTTRGGGAEYQLSLTGGATWQEGGFLLAYDRGESNAIYARNRRYVVSLDDPTTLLPQIDHDAILLSAHQRLAPVTLSLDALYSRRANNGLVTTGGTVYELPIRARAFSISPAIDIDLSGGWTGRLVATYGKDEDRYTSLDRDAATRAILYRSAGCYCNATQVAEANVEGPIFNLPAGDVRIAAGGGYRRNSFHLKSYTNRTDFGGAASSSYAYGELSLPFVAPAMDVPAIYRLNLSGAVRYEKYNRIPGTTTPKLGLVYEPTADFGLKATWGRSFKAASLTQQYSQGYGALTRAANLGGTGYPTNALAIYFAGPNPSLRPEHAESWTGTLAVHPRQLSGLNLEVSYFDIDYTDRIITPVNNLFAALSEPAYAPFVTRFPTPAQVAAAVAAAGGRFTNATGGDLNSAVAIVNLSYANSASDRVSGVDVSGSYSFGLGGGDMTVRGSGSWLKGRRQLLANGPAIRTAGVIFNPPGFRGRAGFTWDRNGFGVSAFVSHLDGVFANYFVVKNGDTGSFDTVDLNLRYASPATRGPLAGFEIALAVDNLLDTPPPLFQVSFAGLPNYDSTNYSSIGRRVALTVTKKW